MLLNQKWFDYLREILSGYTSQPVREPYVDNCDFTWDNIKRGADIWLLIHFLISMLLALAVRNRLFCWVNSIMWELIEFSYSWFAVFNYQYARECWYDSVIFDILIFNALGIEVGLLILRCLMQNVYRLYPEWNIAFKEVFCKCRWKMKYIFVIINVLFLWSFVQLPAWAFYEYTFWLSGDHWLSVISFIIVGFSAVPAYGQLYKWMFKDVSCCSRSSFKNSYWIIIV